MYLCKFFLKKSKRKDMQAKEIRFKIREDDEFIQLIQLLKATNIAENGAMAQNLVVDGLVKHNGEVDLRKRAKIRRGDIVEVFDKKIIVE
jgi:ribosome-associated protein